jgi:ketosteroid isomerase-like protein
MSELARNKQVVARYIEAANRGDGRAIADTYAPGGIHIVTGNTLISGTYTKEQMCDVAGQILQAFPAGLTFRLGSMVAEGDKVFFEVESQGTHHSGLDYNNFYMWAMQFRDGMVVKSKEYFDTEHTTAVLCGGQRKP